MQNRLFIFIITAFFAVSCCYAANKKFVLVIDAGHGGKDIGAPGKVSNEKDINLSVALAFGKYVERNSPDVKVIYTRKTDVFVPLKDRANIANSNKADLFISIHTNALDGGKISRGLETYTLGMHRAADNLNVAKRENSVILIEKNYKQSYAGFDPKSSESYIMFELMQDKNMANSVELAKLIQADVCANSGRINKGVHQAGFLVLRETSMPSCLIELGFITTPDEEQFLNTPEGQDKIAQGIFTAFQKYKKRHAYGAYSGQDNNDSGFMLADNGVTGNDKSKSHVKEDDGNLLAATEYSEQRAVRPIGATVSQQPRQQEAKPAAETKQGNNQPKTQTQSQVQTQSKPQTQSQPKTQTQPQIQSQPKTQTQPQTQSQPKTQTQPQTQSQQKTQTQSQTQSQSKTQTQPQSQSQPKTQTQSQAQSQSKTQQQSQAQQSQDAPIPKAKAKREGLTTEEAASTTPNTATKDVKPTEKQPTTPPKEMTASPKTKDKTETTTPKEKINAEAKDNNKAVAVKEKIGTEDSGIKKQQTVSKPTETKTKNDAKVASTSSEKQKEPLNVVTTAPDSVTLSGRPIFKVQIAANSQLIPLNSPVFHGVENIDTYQENNMVKYTVGATTNYEEILALRKQLLDKFPQAFIIAFRDGYKIDMQQALREYKKNKNK